MPKLADFKTDAPNWWCPGCGDFGVLAALQKALVDLGLEPHQVAIVAGIGCSGKIGNYINSYNFHVVHGRTLPTALGMKLANRDLTVLAVGGDGDGYAIGMGHFMHAVRRNANIAYIVMDNHVYGLTKGQVSPTSAPGFKTISTPGGNTERPVRPIQLALAAGATFVAQGFSAQVKQLSQLIADAIQHRGFSLVSAISPCVTYNYLNTYDWYRQGLVDLSEDKTYDPTDRVQAIRRVVESEEMVVGLIYKEEGPSFEDLQPGYAATPLVKADLKLTEADFEKYLAAYR